MLTSLLVLAAVGILLMVLVAVFLRRGLARMLGGRMDRRVSAGETQMRKLLSLMGQRMGRPWMPQELMAVADLNEEELATLLRRGKQYVRRDWEDHPVTGEEYEALRLNARGVRAFGKYAPDDMDAGEVIQEVDEPVYPEDLIPVVRIKEQQPEEEDVPDAEFIPDDADDLEVEERLVPPLPSGGPRGLRRARR